MKKALLAIFAVTVLGCSDGAKEFNQEFVQLEKSFTQGEIADFNIAKDKLNELKIRCNERLAEIEFDSDQESIREIENLRSVVAKIDEKIVILAQEKQAFDNLTTGSTEGYDYLKRCSNYLAQYPEGLKYNVVQNDHQMALSGFIDDVATKLNGQFTSLDETNTTNNLFHTVSFTSTATGRETQQYQPEDFETALEHFTTLKQDVFQVLDVANVNLITASGNSPQSLKKQMDDYENNIRENRRREEETIRQLISVAVVSQGWDSQAKHELLAYIVRQRGGYFSTCDASTLQNTFTQAEENKVTYLSDRVEVVIHYNVSSLCRNNAKYKYYDGRFTLIFPVINGKLGDGYFRDRSINQTA